MITSNRTRELHDALKRRCLYHWIDFPDARARGRDHPAARARRLRGARALGRGGGRAAARARPREAARRRRGDRLGARARAARAPTRSDGDAGRATLGWAVKNQEDLAPRARRSLAVPEPRRAPRRLRPRAPRRGPRRRHRADTREFCRAAALAGAGAPLLGRSRDARRRGPPRSRSTTPSSRAGSARARSRSASRAHRRSTVEVDDVSSRVARASRAEAAAPQELRDALARASSPRWPSSPPRIRPRGRRSGARAAAATPRARRARPPADAPALVPRPPASRAELARRRRRRRPRRLVLLLDVSRSMSAYSHGARRSSRTRALRADRRWEAFCFGTRLTRVTRALRRPRPATQRSSAPPHEVLDWDGGTRIGDSLKAFLDGHGHGGLARGAVVVLCSDGLEVGDPELLARADGAARAGSRTASSGSTRSRRAPPTSRSRAGCARRSRTSTASRAATTSSRSPPRSGVER